MRDLRPLNLLGAFLFCALMVVNVCNSLILNSSKGAKIFMRRAQKLFSAPTSGAQKMTPLRSKGSFAASECSASTDLLIEKLTGKLTWNGGGVFGKRDPSRTLARAKTFSKFGRAT